jgi:hypothetical protein
MLGLKEFRDRCGSIHMKFQHSRVDIVVHACKPSTLEAEEGGLKV